MVAGGEASGGKRRNVCVCECVSGESQAGAETQTV